MRLRARGERQRTAYGLPCLSEGEKRSQEYHRHALKTTWCMVTHQPDRCGPLKPQSPRPFQGPGKKKGCAAFPYTKKISHTPLI